MPSRACSSSCCSNKGFLNVSSEDYLVLLDRPPRQALTGIESMARPTTCLSCKFVGGGLKPESALLTVMDTKQDDGPAELDIRIVDLDGETLYQKQWSTT